MRVFKAGVIITQELIKFVDKKLFDMFVKDFRDNAKRDLLLSLEQRDPWRERKLENGDVEMYLNVIVSSPEDVNAFIKKLVHHRRNGGLSPEAFKDLVEFIEK